MKTTMKILPLLFGVMLFFTQCEKDVEIDRSVNAEAMMMLKDAHDNADCYVEQDLWAGAGQNITENGELVGKVTASIKDGILTVEYEIFDGWYYVETHLWVGKEISDIPRNAAPGRFPYSGGLLFEDIDLSALGIAPGEPVYIAAHAVVAEGFAGLEDFEAALPPTATFEVVLNAPASYLLATVTDAGILNGDYLSYCIDPGILIDVEEPYSPANVYSSYLVPDGIVTFKGNFPQVNWIINNVFVEEGVTTMADIQEAIWVLLFGPRGGDPGFPTSGPNSLGANQIRVDEILLAAADYTEFMPECGDDLVIVLYFPGVQPIIIWKPIPCGDDETAWAFGEYTFIDKGIAKKWGWIFDMTYCEPLP